MHNHKNTYEKLRTFILCVANLDKDLNSFVGRMEFLLNKSNLYILYGFAEEVPNMDWTSFLTERERGGYSWEFLREAKYDQWSTLWFQKWYWEMRNWILEVSIGKGNPPAVTHRPRRGKRMGGIFPIIWIWNKRSGMRKWKWKWPLDLFGATDLGPRKRLLLN